MDLLFDIENMKCSYKKDGAQLTNVVLEIENLKIPPGKVVFFVGPSGIGKSTILETLGFMNQTIATVDKFEYAGRDVRNIWNWDDKKVSAFRNKEFSFIFQQCNLMQNFTAYENVMATALIQGVTKETARRETNKVLKMMDLPSNEDRPIYQYSGGQQQRLAFARAILPQFKVLFGDEPTGNLDVKSAENLMRVLIEAIKERQASAIIVSHDMHLAVNYADMIVQIHRVARESEKVGVEHYLGKISATSIYEKGGGKWLHCGETFTNDALFSKLMEEI
ncbi:MAG: ATP-binding cassette domain-containing protein [Paludibacteraceae bacterium]|nr:ATP-binding cassette domain-containing protein [Paludibacteraceae bacterium]